MILLKDSTRGGANSRTAFLTLRLHALTQGGPTMKTLRNIALSALAFTALAAVPYARADDTQAHVDRAIAKLNDIDKLIDGVSERQARGGGAVVAETMKCPACGMEMSTVCTNPKFKAFSIKGKVFYCCTGCRMRNARPVKA